MGEVGTETPTNKKTQVSFSSILPFGMNYMRLEPTHPFPLGNILLLRKTYFEMLNKMKE